MIADVSCVAEFNVRLLFNHGGNRGSCDKIELMGLFKQIFAKLNRRFNSSRKSHRIISSLAAQIQSTPPCSARVMDMSFGGLKLQLDAPSPAFWRECSGGHQLGLELSLTPELDRVILAQSPLMTQVKVLRQSATNKQLAVKWVEINPVVLSTLLRFGV